jgi:general stress protein 26
MNNATHASAELDHIAKLIKPIPIAMLTTLDAHRTLSSRPMGLLEMDWDGALWFFTDIRSTKVKHLEVANLSFTDLDRSTYVSLSGHGEVVKDRERIERLWTAFAKPWFPDGPDSPSLALLKFVPAAADYWDAPDSRMVRAFGTLASIVAGRPIGMGEHGSIPDLASPSSTASSGS